MDSLYQTTELLQVPLIDMQISPDPIMGVKKQKMVVRETLGKINRLYEELNTQLKTNTTQRPQIHSPRDLFSILVGFIGALDHEEFWVIGIDTRNRVMSLVRLYVGNVNSSTVRACEVYRQAIIDNSTCILIAHNHPSGDCSFSPEDISTTKMLTGAGKILDIQLMDHIVIGGGSFKSIKEEGLL